MLALLFDVMLNFGGITVASYYVIFMLVENCMLPFIRNIVIHKTNFNFCLSGCGTSYIEIIGERGAMQNVWT